MEIIFYIALVIVIIWSFSVQGRLKSLVKKYSKVESTSGKTANECVDEMLRRNGVYGVTVDHVPGELTDNYNPKENKIYLSDSVYGHSTITAIAIAAHECGHACQASDGWAPYKIRQLIAPFAGFASKASIWIAMGGIFLMYLSTRSSNMSYQLGFTVCTLGIVLYTVVFLFYLVTLPIERNASKRGLEVMQECGWVSDDQLKAAKKVLWAAGDTYAVALASSALTLLSLLLRRGRARK